MGEEIIIRPNLRANPYIRQFAEAVMKAAEETGVSVKEMEDTFGMLTDMAERRIRRTEVAALKMKLPE